MTALQRRRPTTINRLYGRSSGHKLRKGQGRAGRDTASRPIAVPEEERDHGRQGCSARIVRFICEIGFGGGEHLAYRADLLPDHGSIGCEPIPSTGVAQALTHIRDQRTGQCPAVDGRRPRRAPASARPVADHGLSSFTPTPGPRRGTPSGAMMNDGPVDLIAVQDEARRRVPGGDRRPDLSQLAADDHAAPHRTSSNGSTRSPANGWIIRPAGPKHRYAAKARRAGRGAASIPLPPSWLNRCRVPN